LSYNAFLGVLLDNAQDLIKQPDLGHDDFLRRFKLTMTHAMSYGLTSIHDAGLNPQSMEFFKKFACLTLPSELIFIRVRLAAENALPVIVVSFLAIKQNSHAYHSYGFMV
jgi:hypothetical protein